MTKKVDITEKELVQRAVDGDRAAFASVVSKYDNSFRGYMSKLCLSAVDCNDLVQESYIKAFLNISKYNDRYPFEVWLKAIGRNNFIDNLRRTKSLSKNSSEEIEQLEEVEENTPEDIFISNERASDIENRLSIVPEPYKTIIELRYFQSLSYGEIAKQLDIPIGTVKTRLFRAKSILIDILHNINRK